ncbi:SDR family oxidoreductase (plasmid) [Weissella confusa]|uniref:SDR family oxidoreductase n=1 Tax=Weissella confusa TaxID=1583 RepID=UPI001C6F7CC0|nr:SDR family oxidoreductase [Weissella confusa]QYU59004.1 SDR family oxidoreductase [Weissella confusa]
MSNYIIVGADSFVGNALATRLKQLGHFVVGFGFNYVESDDYYRIDYLKNNWRDLFNNAMQKYTYKFDGLVFSVGLMTHDSIHDLTYREWNKTLDVNQTAFIFTVKDSLQYLSSNASIVGVASQNGVVGHEDRISYGATKAAMIQLIKDVQVDLSKADLLNCASMRFLPVIFGEMN